MIEQKLQMAADNLPEPGSDYLSVEERMKKKKQQRKTTPKRRRLAIVLSLAVLLVGCVAGPTVPEYHLYNGSFDLLFPGIGFDVLFEEMGWDPTLNSAKKAAEDLGWTVPETLGGSPCYGAGKYNLTTEKSHYLTAMLFHTYTYYSVDYGFEMVTEITKEDGHQSDAHWTDADASLTFGSMDNDVWRRQFGFDKNDVWVGFNGLAEYEDSFVLDYEGITLYVGTRRYDSDFYGLYSYYGQYIHWVDYDHNTAFSLYTRDDTPDFAIECAKDLIDQMK